MKRVLSIVVMVGLLLSGVAFAEPKAAGSYGVMMETPQGMMLFIDVPQSGFEIIQVEPNGTDNDHPAYAIAVVENGLVRHAVPTASWSTVASYIARDLIWQLGDQALLTAARRAGITAVQSVPLEMGRGLTGCIYAFSYEKDADAEALEASLDEFAAGIALEASTDPSELKAFSEPETGISAQVPANLYLDQVDIDEAADYAQVILRSEDDSETQCYIASMSKLGIEILKEETDAPSATDGTIKQLKEVYASGDDAGIDTVSYTDAQGRDIMLIGLAGQLAADPDENSDPIVLMALHETDDFLVGVSFTVEAPVAGVDYVKIVRQIMDSVTVE